MLNVNFHQKGRKVMDRCVMAFVRHKREGTEVTLLNLINSAGACRSTFKGRVHLQHLTRWIIPPSLTWGGSKQWSCYDHIKFDMLTITGVMQERALKPGNLYCKFHRLKVNCSLEWAFGQMLEIRLAINSSLKDFPNSFYDIRLPVNTLLVNREAFTCL